MNVLWIMADQLRWDYLSCYGHPALKTPNLDALARRGVRFDRAYVQSPICGASRMSFYTGRYVRSHGSTWNGFPLRIGEITLGDHLRPLGVRSVVVGKTHMVADLEGMARLGVDPASTIGVYASQCGFEPYERDDGLHPAGDYDPNTRYDAYLRRHGFGGENPWNEWANSAQDGDGRVLSGWFMQYSNRPARVPAEHSETPYITRRAMDFMAEAGDAPWLCHLSYIKPHWPYIAPAPYHDLYRAKDVLAPVRSRAERETDHPVYRAYQNHRVCKAFSRDDVRERVIPAYMGLVKQIDDQLGVLFEFMDRKGLLRDTMIVFTSDHGDYLGDHWLGEKDFFHEAAVKVPLIVTDPRPAADASRGSNCELLVEAIDLVPTFLEYFGGAPMPHVVEGRSLLPVLEGRQAAPWREYAVSEYDYATRDARLELGLSQADARMFMVRDARWKYLHFEGFRPMLFDLARDPNELIDLGGHAEHAHIRQRMRDGLLSWALRHHSRTTLPPQRIDRMAGTEPPGILIGYWEEKDLGA